MSVEIIDLTKAEINYISANHLFRREKLTCLSVGIEVNGFSKSVSIKGEKLERVLDLIKEIIVEDE